MVVSPHLDDAVLSLGALVGCWARAGVRVELLTVLACDPGSAAPAGGWDRRAGFATEGESAGARREEDRRACDVLGAHPRWLPYGSVDYQRHGDEAAVRAAVADAVGEAGAVLLPGFPLSHPDHAWLVRALAGLLPGWPRLGLYAEQPYTWRSEAPPQAPEWVARLVGELRFERVSAGAGDRLAKWRAVRAYRSQLELLALRTHGGLPLARLLASEWRLGGEAVAWR